MLTNLLKNATWFITALESLAIAALMEFQQFNLNDKPPFGLLSQHLADPYIPLMIGLIGLYGLVVSLWDLHRFYAEEIMVFSFQFLYVFLLVIFAGHSIERNGGIDMMSILLITTTVRIFVAWIQRPLLMKIVVDKTKRKWGDSDE